MTKEEIRQKHFVNDIVVKGKDPAESYADRYNAKTPDSVAVGCSQLLRKPVVTSMISKKLDAVGLSVDDLNSKLAKLTQANRSIITKDGIEKVEDNPTRLESTKTAYKLQGFLRSDAGSRQPEAVVNINVGVDKAVVAGLKDAVGRLEGLSKSNTGSFQQGEIIDAEVVESPATDGDGAKAE